MARILVIDDEPAVLNNLRRYVASLGHDVRTATNGGDALVAVREHSLDLVITDLNMPGMDGLELLNSLRARDAHIPVIAISGGGQFDKKMLLASAQVLGAAAILEKPFELEELSRAIEGILED